LGLMIVTLFWAFGRLLLQLVRRGGMPFVFFTSVALVELVRAFVESEMMRPFVLAHMLIWIGAIYVSKYPLRS
jgi:exopolysaccharide production protein ExoQ